MIETLIKGLILLVLLVIVFVGITWALSYAGITLPPVIVGCIIALLILAGVLWLWRNRGSLGL